MPHPPRHPDSLPARPPRDALPARTYIVVAVGEGGLGTARPLGTVEAAGRTAARALACVLHADVAPWHLRVQAAGGAPADLVARALAMDAVHAMA